MPPKRQKSSSPVEDVVPDAKKAKVQKSPTKPILKSETDPDHTPDQAEQLDRDHETHEAVVDEKKPPVSLPPPPPAPVTPVKKSLTGTIKGSWTQEQDTKLHFLITNGDNGNKVQAKWDDIYKGFCEAFPDAGKSKNSLQMRWKTALRGGDTDLTEREKLLFKRAVNDIDGNERSLAYAWRFKELGGKDINKSAAGKLAKMLRAGKLDAAGGGVHSPVRKPEAHEREAEDDPED